MYEKKRKKRRDGKAGKRSTETETVSLKENSGENGIKDDYEPKVQNVPVLLLDENGNIVTNSKNEVCVVWSGNDGTYIFSDIYKGNYTIVFLYESSKYSATIYRKYGTNEIQAKLQDAEWKDIVIKKIEITVNEASNSVKDAPIDMFSIVIVGNSNTYVRDGKMITPRGYEDKYGFANVE